MTPVVVMCGGRGMRLHPLTENTPKPLFRIGGKSILEQIVEGFVAQGFRRFFFCVNYRGDLIERYFSAGERFGAEIAYVREPHALGTAGALGLLPAFAEPFIVTNADVLAKIDYRKLLDTHLGAQATVCLALHQHQIPYGVAVMDAGKLVGLREKPIENVLVNAGVYALDTSVQALVPGGYLDMPDLIAKCRPLAYYPIEGAWYDCGNFQDMTRANNEWRG